MMHIREHGVADYEALRDMDATDVGILDDSDRECLREIGDYLAGTDAWRRFAVWLLHKHFEPGDGEIFVERAVFGENRTETAPIARVGFTAADLNASGVRFDDASGETALVGLEYAGADDFDGVAPLGADDEIVLSAVADRLRSHGKIDRFGVKLIRNPLGLGEGQLLLETCDTSTRIQHCEVAARDALPTDVQIIETTWRWRVLEGTTTPVVMQDCTAGCTPIGEGHDLAHRHSQTDNDDNLIP